MWNKELLGCAAAVFVGLFSLGAIPVSVLHPVLWLLVYLRKLNDPDRSLDDRVQQSYDLSRRPTVPMSGVLRFSRKSASRARLFLSVLNGQEILMVAAAPRAPKVRTHQDGALQSATPSSVLMKEAGDEMLASYQLIEEAWKRAETILAQSHVPTDVKVPVGGGPIGPEEQPCGEYTQFLAYTKLKNQWRICFATKKSYYQGMEPETEWDFKPIAESPVETRLEMFDKFQELYDEVMKVTKGYVPMIKERVAKFATTLAAIDFM